MNMTQYQIDMEALKAKRCSACYGFGTCDDASEHDITFNTWDCNHCGKTGYEPEVVS